jgi:hypothetical protein
MPNDRCAVPQVFDLRARIEDRGNRADGLKIVPLAGTNPATVGIFVLDDTSRPLVVDTDDDGVCDAINPKLVPTITPPTRPEEVLQVRLTAIPPAGEADFTPDPALRTPEGASLWGCGPANEQLAPAPLCTPHLASVVIGYPAAQHPASAIWGIAPIGGPGYCLGSQFDAFANNIADGWACIAAAAADRNGNASVSPPLRVWIQRKGLSQSAPGVCPTAPANAGPPPDCTGTVEKATGALVARACRSARRFPTREVRAVGKD